MFFFNLINQSDIRPRVRSFGEKETKDGPYEDTIILRVHGITEAGVDVRCELVQVLQNRLDDAVLEFLSVMLARNAMCPLTPEDVRFIQRPFRLPEIIIKVKSAYFYGLKILQRKIFTSVIYTRICLQSINTVCSLFKTKFTAVLKHTQIHRFKTTLPL